ncbi:hypothetical protein UT300012_21550 [Paraclostridium bifermentans]
MQTLDDNELRKIKGGVSFLDCNKEISSICGNYTNLIDVDVDKAFSVESSHDLLDGLYTNIIKKIEEFKESGDVEGYENYLVELQDLIGLEFDGGTIKINNSKLENLEE